MYGLWVAFYVLQDSGGICAHGVTYVVVAGHSLRALPLVVWLLAGRLARLCLGLHTSSGCV